MRRNHHTSSPLAARRRHLELHIELGQGSFRCHRQGDREREKKKLEKNGNFCFWISSWYAVFLSSILELFRCRRRGWLDEWSGLGGDVSIRVLCCSSGVKSKLAGGMERRSIA